MQQVLQMKFDEIAAVDEFDGIWACASLLPVPNEELPAVLDRMYRTLKQRGTL